MRNLLVVLLATLAVGMAACHSGSDGNGDGAPTVASQVHFGTTECTDYAGVGDPIYLNRRLGQMTQAKVCALSLCFDRGDCMYNCPPELVVGCE